MANLYTRNGRPLNRRGDDIFVGSGKHVGKVKGRKVYGPDGRYVGTIDGNRVVYRVTDSATISGPFVRSVGSPFAAARAVGAAIIGDEPLFPD